MEQVEPNPDDLCCSGVDTAYHPYAEVVVSRNELEWDRAHYSTRHRSLLPFIRTAVVVAETGLRRLCVGSGNRISRSALPSCARSGSLRYSMTPAWSIFLHLRRHRQLLTHRGVFQVGMPMVAVGQRSIAARAGTNAFFQHGY